MKLWQQGVGALAGAILVGAAWVSPAWAAGLEGTYKLQGWNPGAAVSGAGDYGGSFTLAKKGPGYAVTWVTGGATSRGHAIERSVGGKRLLMVGYDSGGEASVAVYEVSADGKSLNGEWYNSDGMGHERLSR